MARNTPQIQEPEITDELLKAAWNHYENWQATENPVQTLYHSPEFKKGMEKFFKKLKQIQEIWDSFTPQHKEYLILCVFENPKSLHLLSPEPMELYENSQANVPNPSKISKDFQNNLSAAIVDYEEYCRDRKQYFNGNPPLNAEKELTRFFLQHWKKHGGEIKNSAALRKWVNSARAKLINYAKNRYGLKHNSRELVRLRRESNTQVRRVVEEKSHP